MSRKSCWNVLAIAAVLSAAAITLIPGSAAARDRPFTAALNGNANLSPTDDPCVMRNDETAEGRATHLGRFTLKSVEFVDFCSVPGGVAVEGKFTMTAANGDKLFGEVQTTGFPDEDGNLVIHGRYRFVGGTGRFAGATGCGDVDVLASLAPGLPFTGMFKGSIDY
jgi:hypothetical protein